MIPALLWIHLDTCERWLALARVRHDLLDPAKQEAIRIGIDVKPLSAPVLYGKGRLSQEQAFFRSGRKSALPACVLDDGAIVGFQIVRADREFEPRLPLRLGVTRAGVATRPAEDGHHVADETDRLRSRCGHLDFADALRSIDRSGDMRGAGRLGAHNAVRLDNRNLRMIRGKSSFCREIDLKTIALRAMDEDTVRFRCTKLEARRPNP